ncbi:hypothetical protein PsalN5692_03057 [Piscirickettsia salmonis]|nr:hypothetical protein PsalN5692_03057 [Piscirickettsia salmonis]QGP53252.1 hypothetical protein PsalSR1_00659 [Piscirickettsia salmonis]QGP60826.1 hypothetical protein PsalBI1_03447 [Piscirickettsia salmonis]QGP62818.1 hypothetical protein PsalMR5_00658 [Piscirickettsia salmonis]
MLLSLITAITLIISLLFFAYAIKCILHKRLTATFLYIFLGSTTTLITTCSALLLLNNFTLNQMTKNTPIAMLSLNQLPSLASKHYQATLSLPSGQIKNFKLIGDDWQLSAQIIVWQDWLHALGLTNRYRFDRIQSRYDNISAEQHAIHSIYPINPPNTANSFWQWARHHLIQRYFIKTVYGNAIFMPMRDGASFTIALTNNGLIATPINLAAKQSIGLA